MNVALGNVEVWRSEMDAVDLCVKGNFMGMRCGGIWSLSTLIS